MLCHCVIVVGCAVRIELSVHIDWLFNDYTIFTCAQRQRRRHRVVVVVVIVVFAFVCAACRNKLSRARAVDKS